VARECAWARRRAKSRFLLLANVQSESSSRRAYFRARDETDPRKRQLLPASGDAVVIVHLVAVPTLTSAAEATSAAMALSGSWRRF